jgi:dipeptidyl aminopeptidase/acylaminoacyl peptidase
MPIWSPDGTHIVYASLQQGKWGLYRKISTGSEREVRLYESELRLAPMSWAGKFIVFWVQDPKTGGDLWVLDLGDKEGRAVPFASETYNETHAQISPDGKWIAYTSNKTGNRNEVYVRPFPSGNGIWQVSENGGDWPRWRRDGKELFYRANAPVGNASLNSLFSVTVRGDGSDFKFEQPEFVLTLLVVNAPHSGGDYHTYDISPDGKRFLYLQLRLEGGAQTPAAAPQFTADPPNGIAIVVNWLSSLREK